MKKYILFSVFLSTSVFAFSQLKINEIMSNNVSALMDEDWNYSMWVELYNAGSSAEDQGAYYFTDDLSLPKQWKPLSKLIAAKGFSLLWFERETFRGHCSFKLAPEGGTLYLMNEAGQVVDQVTYPAQFRNTSYGRSTDGAGSWVFFPQHTAGASNNGKANVGGATVCSAPNFSVKGGFYTSNQSLALTAGAGETIYYTTNGSEPSANSTKYTAAIPLNSNTTKASVIRAISIATGKISSNVITNTYFVGNWRTFDNLTVVSLVTDEKNLFSDTIGIYWPGKNGIIFRPSCTDNEPVNYGRDWQRPTNFEIFAGKQQKLNQEVDIDITGACTRSNSYFAPGDPQCDGCTKTKGYGQKSLKIKPKNKFGNNQLKYNFFPTQKPDLKFKNIILRNSGNDWYRTMLKDGFCQSLVANRMDVDYQAYEPAVCFINGDYYGIHNFREVTTKDYVYTNYGLKDDDIYILKYTELFNHPEYLKFTNFVAKNDVTNSGIYNQIKEMIDIDSFIEYIIAFVYMDNTDWPQNNTVLWKSKINGKWRFFIKDFDGCFETASSASNNSLNRLLAGGNAQHFLCFSKLMENSEFKNKFIRKFSIHISSTFEENRVLSILNPMAAKIKNELLTYHKPRWGWYNGGYFEGDANSNIDGMRGFAKARPNVMYSHLSSAFSLPSQTYNINISSNINHTGRVKYRFFDDEIIDKDIKLRFFSGQTVKITAAKVPGYQFTHWECNSDAGGTLTVNQGSSVVNNTSGSGTLNSGNGIVTFKATPNSGRRVAWYVNGYRLQGQSFNVPGVPNNPSFLNWYNSVDVGALSDADAINRIYLVGGGEAGRTREETLTISAAQLPSVKDVRVEFIRDIAHLASISFSSEACNAPGNCGYHGAVVVDRAVWFQSSAHSATPWIEFDFKSAKQIERLEIRRRTRMNCKVTKYTISFPGTSIPSINKILDARDGVNFTADFEKTDPEKNGDLDDVVLIPNGPVSVQKVRVTITEYRKRDGTSGGTTPDEHQPGFERIKIIESDGSAVAPAMLLWLSDNTSSSEPTGNTQAVGKTVYLYLKDNKDLGVQKINCDLNSSDTNVATISTTGVITIKAAGITTITAVRKSDSATGTLELTVVPASTSTVNFNIKGGSSAQSIITNEVFQTTLTKDNTIKAIYSPSTPPATPKIYINEISGNDKWIELYNDEDVAIDISDYEIWKTDYGNSTIIWTIPAKTVIEPKGYKVWTQNFRDGFTWGISAQRNVTFRLYDENGVHLSHSRMDVKMSDNLYSYGNNRTVGRQTDGSPNLVVFLNGGTKGGSNNGATIEAPESGAGKRIFINEISGNDKWLELYNDENDPIDLSGYIIRKIDDATDVTDWTIPAGTTIAPKGFKVWTQNEGDGFTWGISAQKDVAFKIFDDGRRELDFFEVKVPALESLGNTRTVGRQTDGASKLIIFLNGGTKGSSNNKGTPQ